MVYNQITSKWCGIFSKYTIFPYVYSSLATWDINILRIISWTAKFTIILGLICVGFSFHLRLFAHLETSPLRRRAANFNLYSELMAIKQRGLLTLYACCDKDQTFLITDHCSNGLKIFAYFRRNLAHSILG